MDKKHRGAFSELKGCAWLLEQGYEVFRNVSQHGVIDLVAIKNNEIRKVQIKTAPKGHWSISKIILSDKELEENVALLVVDEKGNCYFDPHPVKFKIEEKICAKCGTKFMPKSSRASHIQKYCSDRCRVAVGMKRFIDRKLNEVRTDA